MADFENLIFFGDSLTDQGIVHDLTSRTTSVTIPVESAGYGAAFTNGAVHAQRLAGLLGAGAQNYAVGGARAVGAVTLRDYIDARLEGQVPGLDLYQPDAAPEDLNFDLNLGGQIQRFRAEADVRPPPPDSAAAFLIGLNDYSGFTPTRPETAEAEGAALTVSVVAATIRGAAAAAEAGVETILLYTLPDFRFFPLATQQTPETLALGDQVVAAHNALLAEGGALLEALGAEVAFIDLNRISAEIRVDPTTFGLDAALFHAPAVLGTGANPRLVLQADGTYEAVFTPNPAVAGLDPDRIAFWDFVHPSAVVHDVWGVFSAASLSSETFLLGDEEDRVVGTEAADLVLAGGGRDWIWTGRGADVILAGLGEDLVVAGKGHDIVSGGSGRDVLAGANGADVLAGGAGGDRAFGGIGADLLIDGAGVDLSHGGVGDDVFVYVDPALGGGRMIGGRGEDTLILVLAEEIRAAVAADLRPGAARQFFDALDLETVGVEHVVLLDPEEDLAAIDAPARLDEALLWGLA